jgi:fructokinase
VITVAGEVLIDLVDEGGGRYQAHYGGSGANVAVGLARLGVPCAMLARISGDQLGRQLAANLAGNGVSLRDVTRAAEPTTLALASLDEEGRAAYSFYANGTADWQWQQAELPGELRADVTALHAVSLVLSLPPGASAVEQLLAAENARDAVTISIDPNIRPFLAAAHADEVARVERQIRLAHLVKASEEDIGWLYPGTGYADVARRWQRLGPSVVVITLGERGAFAVAPGGTEVSRQAPAIEVADTVGAGDAFSAGLLHALGQRGLLGGGDAGLARVTSGELGEVIGWAVLIASLTSARPGADPPSLDEASRAAAAA